MEVESEAAKATGDETEDQEEEQSKRRRLQQIALVDMVPSPPPNGSLGARPGGLRGSVRIS